MSRSSESVWPELLLQANIEQVRKANRQMLFAGPGISAGLTALLPARSLTKCRRVSSPWNNRPQRSRPTWRDLERGLREDLRGLLLRVKLSNRRQSLNRQATCQRSIASLPPLSRRRPPRPTQIPELLSRFARGQLCTFLPLLGACADPEGGSETLTDSVNNYKRKCFQMLSICGPL